MANIKWIINMHKKEVIMEKKTEAVKSNCTSKLDWPLSNQCQITNILYKVKITSNFRNYHEKIYCGASEHTFKQPYGNHKKSINQEKNRTYTELSKEYWRLKKTQSKTLSTILHFKKMPTNKKNRYFLFMFEGETIYHWKPRK